MPQPKSRKNVATNVRRLRQAAGMTQAQLASAADVADATISRIERGRLMPPVELAQRLSRALDVGVDDLLGPVLPEPKKVQMRPAVARLVALVKDMDDGQIDDVTRALKLLLAAARRS